MNQAERTKMAGDTEQSFEEGHYFGVIHMFADFLVDAYNDGADGKKYELLMETLKNKLPQDIFEEVFVGFEPRSERIKRSSVYGYPEIGSHYGNGFYAQGKGK